MSNRDLIKQYLADPKTSGGRDKLYQFIHADYPDISRRMVAAVLKEDQTWQQHRPLNKRVTTRPITVKGPATVAQIDLVDMQKLAPQNDHIRYLLTYVDLFSKYAAIRPLKNKTQAAVVAGLLDILDSVPAKWRPRTIQSDNGAEFQRGMETALAARNIKVVHSAAYQPTTQGQIERLNRTIKSTIFQLMTRNKTLRYIDWLPDLVSNINNSVHTSTGFKPIDLMNGIPLSAEIIASVHARMMKKLKHVKIADRLFSVGDYVRVALTTESSVRKNSFRKKIAANWSPQVYQIYSVSQPGKVGLQPQYLLHNLQTKRNSTKRYWGYQLQEVEMDAEGQKEEAPEEEQKDEDSEEEREVFFKQPAPQRSLRERVPASKLVTKHGERVLF